MTAATKPCDLQRSLTTPGKHLKLTRKSDMTKLLNRAPCPMWGGNRALHHPPQAALAAVVEVVFRKEAVVKRNRNTQSPKRKASSPSTLSTTAAERPANTRVPIDHLTYGLK